MEKADPQRRVWVVGQFEASGRKCHRGHKYKPDGCCCERHSKSAAIAANASDLFINRSDLKL
jgi:hypothetical protein